MIDLVMLIDDSDTDSFIHKRLIEMTGFAVQIELKKSCQSAIEYLQSLGEDQELWPNLIFLDWNMPFEDGPAFLKQLNQMDSAPAKSVKIIVLSGHNTIEKQEIESFKQVVGYLRKPLSAEKLTQISSNWLKN